MPQSKRSQPLKFYKRARLSVKALAIGYVVVLTIVTRAPLLKAQQKAGKLVAQTLSAGEPQAPRSTETTHRFFDRTNLMLFAGVAAVRALDYTSTQHFREQGHNEVLLSNGIVDNKPLFASFEVAGTALSISVAYLLHRTGHHKLERWVSIVHIDVGAFGAIHNYTLGAPPPTQ